MAEAKDEFGSAAAKLRGGGGAGSKFTISKSQANPRLAQDRF